MKNGKGRLTKGQKALKGIKELYTEFGYTNNFKKKSCENCKHYSQDFPPPFCLNCKTGFNNDYRKRDYWEIKGDKRKMSRRKKTFYDVYSELWELLDKPRLKFWQRMRAKQLLYQLLRLHDTHIF